VGLTLMERIMSLSYPLHYYEHSTSPSRGSQVESPSTRRAEERPAPSSSDGSLTTFHGSSRPGYHNR